MDKHIAEVFVNALYQFFLFRGGDPAGLKNYTENVQKFTQDTQFLKLLESFSSSPEFRNGNISYFLKNRLHIEDNLDSGNESAQLGELLPYAQYDPSQQRNLIVTGFPRSGTSALVSLLNFSRDIFVTHELFDFSKQSWLPESFTRKKHIDRCITYIEKNYQKEQWETELLRYIFPEVEVSAQQIWDTLCDGKYLHEYCLHKIADVRENYAQYPMVGDKNPFILSIRVCEKLLLNSHATVLAILRDPYDVYLSYLDKVRRDKYFPDHSDSMREQLAASLQLVALLQKQCPRRITCIRYEGFFTSKERMHTLFSRLGVGMDSLYEPGIDYICERAQRVAQRKRARREQAQHEQLPYTPAHFDHLKTLIDWSQVI